MSIQSTQYITREEAEKMYAKKRVEETYQILKIYSKTLSNETLEDYIEETYDNYCIVEEKRND